MRNQGACRLGVRKARLLCAESHRPAGLAGLGGRGAHPTREDSPSPPNHAPKAPHSSVTTRGVRAPACELGDIQPVTRAQEFYPAGGWGAFSLPGSQTIHFLGEQNAVWPTPCQERGAPRHLAVCVPLSPGPVRSPITRQ